MRYLAIFLLALGAQALTAAEPGSSVVVIYNSAISESKQVAEYYAQKRDVPANQVLGFALPENESMTRQEYLDKLERPLLTLLQDRGLFKMEPSGTASNPALKRVIASTIRYAALC